jgi:hypothetical protein
MHVRSFALVVLVAACGSSGSSTPDASSGAQACAAVGTALCHQVYACYSGSDVANLGYPATEAECVTQENASCNSLEPGYCKGSTQTSTANATACATDLSGMTCTEFTAPAGSDDVCKTSLCSQ